MSTYEARACFACASEISPVYAPPASKCACWTAKEIFLPRYSDASPRKYTAGGATTTELFFALSAALFTASNSFFASLKEAGFIFQFATTRAFAIQDDWITAHFSRAWPAQACACPTRLISAVADIRPLRAPSSGGVVIPPATT